jgi:hypothetical protein
METVTIVDENTDQYYPETLEFYLEESNIGGGYMIIPEKNVNFATYYHLQEVEFTIKDSLNVTIFTGMFEEPVKSKNGVRLNFKEITQQLADRICQRSYLLDNGTIMEMISV